MDANELRTSDKERMQVAQILQAAMAEGFLDTAEFDQRTQGVFAARTRGELAAFTADLPPRMRFDVAYDLGSATSMAGIPVAPGPSEQVVIAHNFEKYKQGDGWRVPARILLRSWAGMAVLDFANAELVHARYEIELDAKGSSIKFYLPVGAGLEKATSVSAFGSISDKRPDKRRDERMPVFYLSGRMPFSEVKILGPKRGWWE